MQNPSLHQIIPEFFWNANYTQLLWTVEPNNTASYTGQFSGIPAGAQVPPSITPAWLAGKPVDMARVGAQAQVPTQLIPTNDVSVPVAAPPNPAPAFPHAASRGDTLSTPVVVATYVLPWQSDLTVLGTETNQSLALPGLADGACSTDLACASNIRPPRRAPDRLPRQRLTCNSSIT